MATVFSLILWIHNWRNGVSKLKANLKKNGEPLRIGVLSAAAINEAAIIDPVGTHPGVILTGIAARELSKAQTQIERNKLGPACKAYGSYAELLDDKNIDAVYIPLPNGLHYEWAIKAMEAGKHVLIEKPIASNAQQAREIRDVAARTGKVALEAFHWRFHPAAHTLKSIIESGKYGFPTAIFVRMMIVSGALGGDNIRFNYNLAGGACMDLTYVFSTSSYFASPDISKCHFNIVRAKPRVNTIEPRIDEAMESDFTIEQDGRPPVNCHVQADLAAPPLFGFIPRVWTMAPYMTVDLEKAKVEFRNFVIPSYGHKITIIEKDDKGKLTDRRHSDSYYIDGPQWGSRGQPWWTTYRYQLEAFVGMIEAKQARTEYVGPWMSLEESERLMELIDLVYEKAGLPRRGD